MLNNVSQEAIINSVEDSQRTAKREVEATVEWDDREDMLKKLLKQVINKEITIEEYKMLAEDIKNVF